MHLPSEVCVGPFTFSVVGSREAIHSVDPDCNGVTSKEHCRITLDTGRHSDAVAETLLHEVLHALFLVSGQQSEKMSQHDAIYSLSPLLLDTLRRNPALVTYLCGRTTP